MTTARRQRLLAAMDIDVWVRRDAARRENVSEVIAAAESTTPKPSSSPSISVRAGEARGAEPAAIAAPTSPPTAASVAEPIAAPTPLTALSLGEVVLVGSLPLPQDRRLAQDVLSAAAGYPRETPVSIVWEGSGGATGTSAGRAFVRGQVDRRRAQLLIVMGSADALGMEVDSSSSSMRWTRFDGTSCLLAPAAGRVRTSAKLKQDLWRALIRRP